MLAEREDRFYYEMVTMRSSFLLWPSIHEVSRECLSVCAPVLLRYTRDISVVLRCFFEEWQLGYRAGSTARIDELCHANAIAMIESCTGESDGEGT